MLIDESKGSGDESVDSEDGGWGRFASAPTSAAYSMKGNLHGRVTILAIYYLGETMQSMLDKCLHFARHFESNAYNLNNFLFKQSFSYFLFCQYSGMSRK